jgi:hypothetical protein
MRHPPVHPVPEPAQVTAPPEPVNGGPRGGLALIARTVAGPALLLIGAAMLVLPGHRDTHNRPAPRGAGHCSTEDSP